MRRKTKVLQCSRTSSDLVGGLESRKADASTKLTLAEDIFRKKERYIDLSMKLLVLPLSHIHLYISKTRIEEDQYDEKRKMRAGDAREKGRKRTWYSANLISPFSFLPKTILPLQALFSEYVPSFILRVR